MTRQALKHRVQAGWRIKVERSGQELPEFGSIGQVGLADPAIRAAPGQPAVEQAGALHGVRRSISRLLRNSELGWVEVNQLATSWSTGNCGSRVKQ